MMKVPKMYNTRPWGSTITQTEPTKSTPTPPTHEVSHRKDGQTFRCLVAVADDATAVRLAKLLFPTSEIRVTGIAGSFDSQWIPPINKQP